MGDRRSVDGILLLNKALNISSNMALQQVKRIYNAKKAGHTGSLDPLATGVLPICLGEATKFSGYLLDADKAYTAWGRLGFTSPTGDAEGELTPVPNAPIISLSEFETALKTFIGTIKQIPPIYSALKKDGVPLYKLARKGQVLESEEMEKKARFITIESIQLDDYHYPDFQIKVRCSKGTYIRTLVEDIGKSLNSGAYLLNLRRDEAGPYALEKSYTIEELTAISSQSDDLKTLDALLLPMDTAVKNYPLLTLDDAQTKALQQGKIINISIARYCEERSLVEIQSETLIRLYNSDNLFLGLGILSSQGQLRVQRLVAVQFL